MKKFSVFVLLFSILFLFFSCSDSSKVEQITKFETPLSFSQIPPLPSELGVGGAFGGYHNEAVIVAGGANFSKPYFAANNKNYLDTIWFLTKTVDGKKTVYNWHTSTAKLPKPLAYGASVALSDGLLCIGGHNATSTSNEVYQLKYNKATNEIDVVTRSDLKLPYPLTQASAVATSYNSKNALIYLLCGSTTENIESAQGFMFKCDYSAASANKTNWQTLITKNEAGVESQNMPFSARILAPIAYQHDGSENALFIFSGRNKAQSQTVDTPYGLNLLTDCYKYLPSTNSWKRLSNAPECLMAGAAYSFGLNHIVFLNGTNGETLKMQVAGTIDEQKSHPGFDKRGWVYHTVTDSWNYIDLPQNQLTTPPIRLGSDNNAPMLVVSGEVAPRVRTSEVLQAEFVTTSSKFSWLDFAVIILYLLGSTGVGVFFYFRNKNVDDFFKGGGRIPFWVAAMSLFATMLSSITFIAVPGKVYATNWCNYLLNVSMFVVTPFVIMFFLPFFRRIKSASAYEYLEKRFNLGSRMFASTIFIIYHIIRMGIVMYLPALALSSIVKLNPDPQINMVISILIMAVLSIIYCSLGGLEAVVWTETVQGFVLLSGAFITVLIIIAKVGGLGEFFATANAYNKFTIAVPDFAWDSFKRPVLWVILLGGIGQNLIPYASDQAVIQRYMSVKDMGSAKKSMWTNTFISVAASALFFFVGTALFVFYKKFSSEISPSISKVDEIFPNFIVAQLPIGLAGLVVAAILAAAQSTVATSINSATAVLISDFVIRFSKTKNDKRDLILSRVATVIFGTFGTVCALILVSLNNPSLWDTFMDMLGLVLGALCGLFLLGIFFKRANGVGAIIGVIGGIAVTLVFKKAGLHGYITGFVNFTATMLIGAVASGILNAIGISGETDLTKAKGIKGAAQKILYTENGNKFKYSYAQIREEKKNANK